MQKKYETVIAWVTEGIESGALRYGEKLPSEKELAERFGVSRQTVRRALEDLNRDGIVESRKGSGTYAAATGRRRTEEKLTIAAMLTYVDTYIFPSIIKGMESEISREENVLQITMNDNTAEKERRILQDFVRMGSIDGLIAEAVRSSLPNPNLDLYRQLEKAGIPVLFVNSWYDGLDIPHVSMDDRMAGYRAAKHLLECGHTRIGGVFKSDDGQGRLRYAGYTRALMEKEIPVKDSRVIWMDSEEIREPGEVSEKILRRLQDCTACVCYNDEIACKLVNILKGAGRGVPDDISIIGIDNSAFAQFCAVPPTSVVNPVEELGRTAARKITDRIVHGQKMETTEFQPEICIRDSVRMIRDGT